MKGEVARRRIWITQGGAEGTYYSLPETLHIGKLPSIFSFKSVNGGGSQRAALSTFMVQCSRTPIQPEGTKSRVRAGTRKRERYRVVLEMDSTA